MVRLTLRCHDSGLNSAGALTRVPRPTLATPRLSPGRAICPTPPKLGTSLDRPVTAMCQAGEMSYASSVPLEPGQHREYPAMVVRLGEQVELGQNAADVAVDGALVEHELSPARGVRAALGHQGEHLVLPCGEGLDLVASRSPPEQVAHDVGVEHGAAVGHPVNRIDQCRDVDDMVLQQVAEPLRVVLRESSGVAALQRLRQQQDAEAVVLLAQLRRRASALVREARRHPDVDQRDVRPVLHDEALELVGVAGHRTGLDVGLGEQPGQPFAEQHRVVGDHDPHGSVPITIVPPSGRVRTASAPPTASARSAMPRSPAPCGSASPTPSSLTVRVRVPFIAPTLTSIPAARACLTALLIASQAMNQAVDSICGGYRLAVARISTRSGSRLARSSSAAPRPESLSTAGCSPFASSRSSATAVCSSVTPTAAVSRSRSTLPLTWAACSSSASASSRCWAPSCRSRSMRRRSASWAAAIRRRDSRTSASCSEIAARSPALTSSGVASTAAAPAIAGSIASRS